MQTVLTLLLICSLITGLITEALKKTIPLPDNEYSKNILAGIVSVIVSIAVSAGYLILNNQALTKEISVYIVALIVLSWLTSMLGYDKIMQTIQQIQKDGKVDGTGK